MAKKNTATATVKKSTAGIPRITAAILGLDAQKQAEWVDGLKNVKTGEPLNDEQKADVRARLEKAVANPKASKASKVMDWGKLFSNRSAEELVNAAAALAAASATAISEEEKAIAEVEARIEQRKAKVLAAKAGQQAVTA